MVSKPQRGGQGPLGLSNHANVMSVVVELYVFIGHWSNDADSIKQKETYYIAIFSTISYIEWLGIESGPKR